MQAGYRMTRELGQKAHLRGQATCTPSTIAETMTQLNVVLRVGAAVFEWNDVIEGSIFPRNGASADPANPLVSLDDCRVINEADGGALLPGLVRPGPLNMSGGICQVPCPTLLSPSFSVSQMPLPGENSTPISVPIAPVSLIGRVSLPPRAGYLITLLWMAQPVPLRALASVLLAFFRGEHPARWTASEPIPLGTVAEDFLITVHPVPASLSLAHPVCVAHSVSSLVRAHTLGILGLALHSALRDPVAVTLPIAGAVNPIAFSERLPIGVPSNRSPLGDLLTMSLVGRFVQFPYSLAVRRFVLAHVLAANFGIFVRHSDLNAWDSRT